MRKRSSVEYIDPQIADLFGACAVHIDEMSSVSIRPHLSCFSGSNGEAFG